MLHPGAQVLGRHDLAAEQDPAHGREGLAIQPVEARDEAQSRYRPGHHRDPLLFQVIHKGCGLREQGAGHHHEGATAGQGPIDVLDGHIEIEGSLVGDAVIAAEAEQPGEVADEVGNGSVAHGHALGRARGARGEQHVGRVGIGEAAAAGHEGGLVERSLQHIGSGQQLSLSGKGRGRSGGAIAVGHDEGVAQGAGDAGQAVGRHLRIYRHVEPTGVKSAEHDAEGVDALLHVDDNGPMVGLVGRQGAAGPLGPMA